MQAVGARVGVVLVVGGDAEVALRPARQVYAEAGVAADGVRKDAVARATVHEHPVAPVPGDEIASEKLALTEPTMLSEAPPSMRTPWAELPRGPAPVYLPMTFSASLARSHHRNLLRVRALIGGREPSNPLSLLLPRGRHLGVSKVLSPKYAKNYLCLVHSRDACPSHAGYAAAVARPTDGHVKAQDSHLPSFYIGVSNLLAWKLAKSSPGRLIETRRVCLRGGGASAGGFGG